MSIAGGNTGCQSKATALVTPAQHPPMLPAMGPSPATGKFCFQARFWQLPWLDEEPLHHSGWSQGGSVPALSQKERAAAPQAAPVWRAICFPWLSREGGMEKVPAGGRWLPRLRQNLPCLCFPAGFQSTPPG